MQIIGLDFSGARNAGEKTWVCSGRIVDHMLIVEMLVPASNLPGGAVNRAAAHVAVRDWIVNQPGAVVGCDFPFSLPAATLDAPSWVEFAAGFEARFPTPEHFRHYGDEIVRRAKADGQRATRRTDQEARTPFAPHNLRIYRQTYYGIRDLLAPLSASGTAGILPMQPWRDGQTSVVEVCPASLLKPTGLYAPYKGRESVHRQQRERIFDYAQNNGITLTDESLRRTVLEDTEADALDSLLCALATWRALPDLNASAEYPYSVEGRVFGW